ncbi:MAG: aspartate aminotransferase family protein [Elusimicrobiota bacterium]
MSYKADEEKYLLTVYKRYPVCIVKGKGKYIWDDKGKKYLDFLSGIAVNAFGHCHPAITNAVKKQADTLAHACNLFYTKPQIELGRKLISFLGCGKIFLSNSGAEANECAIKIARKWGRSINSKKYEIISFEKSFHGRTIATLSATGQKKMHYGFKPLLKGFKFAKFNNIDSVKSKFSNKTCAVIIESIQGEGGVYSADKKFIKDIEKLCARYNALLIFDEIQVGMGRTGNMFAYKEYGVKPDIVTLAKALGGGFPLGATFVKSKIKDTFTFGSHGSTFGGNLISCAAAIEVLKLLKPSMLNHISAMGAYLLKSLNALKEKHGVIKDIRGKGLILGAELSIEAGPVVLECLKKGLSINAVQGNTLRFLPPYIIQKKDIDEAMKILDSALADCSK